MAIIVPKDYHIEQQLRDHRVHCITPEHARHQDIRPLRIGILNIMPQAEQYEFNLLFLLGRSIIQIEPVWLRLSDHSYTSSDQQHIDDFYIPFEQAIEKRGFDGLIVTGAPVEELPFEDVTYWNELNRIFTYAHDHIATTLGICWGGLALARYLGIEKITYEQKLFGVYPSKNIDRNHPITGDLDDQFWCPQSRHAGIPDAVLEQQRDRGTIRLLAFSEEAGYTIFESTDGKFMMHLGHPEYPTDRLIEEYRRDLARERGDVQPPKHLDIDHPVNSWRSHGQEFFLQWVKKAYLDTPYEI
ncbi:MAG: homoserine O-succinyltransferase [Spirochaetia bacterium]|nr:homoserine O-succinyltransferase [Spirochaetia bacterium]